MKPMGTITKYYPFIDEDSKTILNSLMEESSRYYDFVQGLCHVVLESDVPINLAYIAADRDLPGIRMQAALLMSEFYQNNGQFKDAQAILTDALKITDSLGVASLRTKINERIKELDGPLSEAGVPLDRKKD